MNTNEDQNQMRADIDGLLLRLDHQLIDLRHAVEHRFERESLSEVLRALLAAQPTFAAACVAVADAAPKYSEESSEEFQEGRDFADYARYKGRHEGEDLAFELMSETERVVWRGRLQPALVVVPD